MATSGLSLSKTLAADLANYEVKPKGILKFAKEDLGLELYPVQIFLFKLFYSIPLSDDKAENLIKIPDKFNETILYEFSEVEFIEYLYKTKRINVSSVDKDRVFLEICFFIGRRGTKTTMSSVITLYTIYMILLLPNPHKYFGILEEDEIGVALVSNSKGNADRQFRSISKFIYKAPFFKKHLVKNPVNGELFLRSTRLLDPKNKVPTEQKGDILIATFAANPNVRGASNIVTISDEFAHFLDCDVSSKKNPLDKLIYEALTPSTSGFASAEGVPMGKNFFITSPNGERGMAYSMYKEAMGGDDNKDVTSLVINIPSAWVNPKIKSQVLKKFFARSEQAFRQEYLAEFIKQTGTWLTGIADMVYSCINKLNNNYLKVAKQNYDYYAGIDFGIENDGTAIAIAHYEPYTPIEFEALKSVGQEFQAKKDCIVVDYVGYLLPEKGQVIPLEEIYKLLNDVFGYYPWVQGMYDQWSGAVFEQLLPEQGFVNLEKKAVTQITNSAECKLFRQLLVEQRLILPNYPDFTDELFRLEETVTRDSLIKVEDTVEHDDRFDAVRRAVWQAYNAKGSNLKAFNASNKLTTRGSNIIGNGRQHAKLKVNSRNIRQPQVLRR